MKNEWKSHETFENKIKKPERERKKEKRKKERKKK